MIENHLCFAMFFNECHQLEALLIGKARKTSSCESEIFKCAACAAHSPLKSNRIIFRNRNLLFDSFDFICYFCTLQTPSKQMPFLSPQTFLNPQPDIYQGNKRAQVVPVFIHWRPTMVNKQGEWKTNPAVCSQIHPVQYNPQTEAFCCVGLTAGCGGITIPYLHRPVRIKYSSHKKHKKGKRSSECASAKAEQRGKL